MASLRNSRQSRHGLRYASKSMAKLCIQFIERCSTLDPAACADCFQGLVRQIGFAGSACGAWAGVGRNRKHRFFFVDWPRDWLELYQREGFFQHDMLAIETRRRASAFWCNDLIAQMKLTPKQQQLVDAFIAYGWKDVFAVPIHGPGSLQGLVTAVTRKDVALGPADSVLLEGTARMVWERCRTSEGFGESTLDRPQLSPREIECLQWVAVGKTDTEIAAIIGISPATAHFHVEQAKKKLREKTRAGAVALGVLYGVI